MPVRAPTPPVSALEPERALRHSTVWLADRSPLLRSGARVAITAGSRAFVGFVPLLVQLGGLLRTRGLRPFLIPSMGSHGGGTPGGQRRVLAGEGVTEDSVGMPVLYALRSAIAGRPVTVNSPVGTRVCRVFCHPGALEADAVIVVNRVQSHTAFDGEVQSGLLKMTAIGLGGPEGAVETHVLGAMALEASILEISRAVCHHLRLAGGIALVQDLGGKLVATKPTASGWDGLRRTDVSCLALAQKVEPRLPVDDVDLLLVDWVGKDVTGTGMHPKVVGRRRVWESPDPAHPRVRRVVAFRLTPGSVGNANGIGLADFTTRRLAEAINWPWTLKNVLTTGFTQRAALPPAFPDDRAAVEAALLTLRVTDPAQVRAIRVRNTGRLGDYWVSEALLGEVMALGAQAVGPPSELPFGPDGNLLDI